MRQLFKHLYPASPFLSEDWEIFGLPSTPTPCTPERELRRCKKHVMGVRFQSTSAFGVDSRSSLFGMELASLNRTCPITEAVLPLVKTIKLKNKNDETLHNHLQKHIQ
jgi:hypothetical protein